MKEFRIVLKQIKVTLTTTLANIFKHLSFENILSFFSCLLKEDQEV